MRGIILVLLLAIFAVNGLSIKRGNTRSTEDTPICQTFGCAAAGGYCTSDYSLPNFISCPDNQYCNVNVCTPFPSTGASCQSSLECADGNLCIYNFSSPNPAICQAFTETGIVGQACTQTAACSSLLNCNSITRTCTKLYSLGQNCTSDDECGGAAFCHQKLHTCTAENSVATGAFCYFDFYCVPGDWCNGDTCAVGFASSLKPCNSSTDCNQYETCTCQANGDLKCEAPSVYTQNETTITNDYYNCLWENNCDDTSTFASCVPCQSEVCNYFYLLEAEFDLCLDPAEKEIQDECAAYFPLSQASHAVVSITLLIAMMVAAV